MTTNPELILLLVFVTPLEVLAEYVIQQNMRYIVVNSAKHITKGDRKKPSGHARLCPYSYRVRISARDLLNCIIFNPRPRTRVFHLTSSRVASY